MKKNIILLLICTLTLASQDVSAQLISTNLSDWNVPPPIPPGTMAKGVGVARQKAIALQIPRDIDVPPSPIIVGGVIPDLAPILKIAPAVPAPAQPAFPRTPQQTPDIFILNVTTVALNAPDKIPADEVGKISLDIPKPEKPGIPVFPKMPDTSAMSGSGRFSNMIVTIPITPAVLRQPDTELAQAQPSPSDDWPLPPININSNNTIVMRNRNNE